MKRTVIIFLAMIQFSCTHKNYNDIQLEQVLEQAAGNRKQLEKVLDHYAAPSDSLKYKAAVFLIKYMRGKFAKVYPEYNNYKGAFDTLSNLNAAYDKTARNVEYYQFYKRTVFNHYLTEHHLKKTSDLDFIVKYDIREITADYLIENIDYAFKGWAMPWNKKLNFNDFCEYILPYRYGNEELQSWRKSYYENNSKLISSLKTETDPVKAALTAKVIGCLSASELSDLQGLKNAIKALDLIRINTSTTCFDETGDILLRLRGIGIPVCRLTVPKWGNWSSGHDFNGVLDSNKKWVGFARGEDKTTYSPPPMYKTTKVFAEIYGDNPNSVAIMNQNDSLQTNPKCVDVTGDIVEATNLTLPFAGEENGTKTSLCIFNNRNWEPLVQSTVHNGSSTFNQIGKGIIYIPGLVRNGVLKLKGNPFLLDSNGLVKPIVVSRENKVITLTRKYPPNKFLMEPLPSLNNCYFQISDDRNFTHPKTLWTINNLTSLHTVEKEIENEKCQYIRLVFPVFDRKNDALGGIQIYGKEHNEKILLKGEPFSSVPASETFYSHVFDNDPLSYIQILNRKHTDFQQYYAGEYLVIPDQQPFWVGFAFKTPVTICSLGFSPRTDDNDVNKGESYELFYWDNKWKSLGQKKAISNELTFSVPQYALYLLKNSHKGKENRIFMYENNKQIWY